MADAGQRGREGGKLIVFIRREALRDDRPPYLRIPAQGVFFRRIVFVYIQKIADGFLAFVAELVTVKLEQLDSFLRPICQPLDSAGDIKEQFRLAFRHERGQWRRSMPLSTAP